MCVMKRLKCDKMKTLKYLVISILIIAAGIGGYAIYGSYRMNQLSSMTFEEMLLYTTRDNKDVVITVGTIQDGKVAYDVYGENGVKLSPTEHIYEIGSITKTFTTSLLCKAISEGKISLDNSVDEYLNLPGKEYYPTMRRLVTHTSGLRRYYFEMPMISNFLSGINDFNGITEEMLIKRLGEINLDDRNYPFKYSNFGTATLGAVLERIYDEDFTTLMNNYVLEDLGLTNTEISKMSGDLGNYWTWSQSDAYMPAGALLSNITDMMKYVQMHMLEDPGYLSIAHEALAGVNASTVMHAKMGIRTDSVGVGWMIDEEKRIIWHNGATGNFNCYIGFEKENKIGVVKTHGTGPCVLCIPHVYR